MAPISATLALISATKAAVSAAKSINDIGATLDQLFSSHEGAQKKKKQQTAKNRQEEIIRLRTGEAEGGETSEAIAQVLEAKTRAYELDLLKAEINRKWPSKVGEKTTWDQILEQRKKLLAERAADQLAKENALAKKAKADKIFWHKVAVEAGKILILCVVVAAIGAFLYYASTAPKIR